MPRHKDTKIQRFFSASLRLCFFASLLLFILAQGAPVLARAQVTPGAQETRAIVIDDTASPTGTLSVPTGSLKEKVQEIRQLVKEKVQERIEEIKKNGTRRAYVGQIATINSTEGTLTVDTKKGTRSVTTNEETKIVDAKRQPVEFSSLKVDDLIIAMGIVNEEDVMTAKRIVVMAKPKTPPPNRRAIHGQVTQIKSAEKTVTITRLPKKDLNYTIKATNETKITKKVDGKVQKVEFAKITVGDWLMAVGTWDEKKSILTAKIIHVVPGLSKPTPKSNL
ncbi:hypothetical protein FJZ40_03825 [Candidatus Shapirobacteria bacterium]|nr:hypothetical protein [Candidatus Shapirobacteria bacterium]